MSYLDDVTRVRDSDRLLAVAHLAAILAVIEDAPYLTSVTAGGMNVAETAVFIQGELEKRGHGGLIRKLIGRLR